MEYYLKCFYCESPITLPFQSKKGVLKGTKDHIVPLIKGGTNRGDNLVPACAICNSSKGGLMLKDWLDLLRNKTAVFANRSCLSKEAERALDNGIILYNSGSIAAIPYSISLVKNERLKYIAFNNKPLVYPKQPENIKTRVDKATGRIEPAVDFLNRQKQEHQEFLQYQTHTQYELAKKHGWQVAKALTAPQENFHLVD